MYRDSQHVQHLWGVEGEVARPCRGHQRDFHSAHHLAFSPRLPLEHRLHRLGLLLILDRQGCQPASFKTHIWDLLLALLLQRQNMHTPLIYV